MMAERTQLAVDKLQQKYRNAIATYYSCGGHNKARMNKHAAERYKDALIVAGGSVPAKEDCLARGVFNGDGGV